MYSKYILLTTLCHIPIHTLLYNPQTRNACICRARAVHVTVPYNTYIYIYTRETFQLSPKQREYRTEKRPSRRSKTTIQAQRASSSSSSPDPALAPLRIIISSIQPRTTHTMEYSSVPRPQLAHKPRKRDTYIRERTVIHTLLEGQREKSIAVLNSPEEGNCTHTQTLAGFRLARERERKLTLIVAACRV